MASIITSLNPAQAELKGDPFTLHVIGAGFASGDTILLAGAGATTFVSATELTAPITPPTSGTASLVQVREVSGTYSNGKNIVWTPAPLEPADPHDMGLVVYPGCGVAPDCVLPSPWPPAPIIP